MNQKFAQRLIAFLIATLFIANQTIIPRPFSALLPEEKLGFASDPTIAVSYNRGGYIDPYGDSQGNVSVPFGTDQTFQIISNPGHSIQDVLVNGGSVGPVSSYTFTNVTENHTIQAIFSRTLYSVAVSVSAGGQMNPSGTNGVVSIPKGGRIFRIIPDTGYRVSDVLLDGNSLGPLQEYSFENVNSNHTLHADFAPEVNNQAPTLQNQVANADMMNPTTLTISGSDPNNDDLTFSIVRQPDHGSLGYVQNEALGTASVLYVPETNYTGDDSFSIVANDGLLDSNEATFTVHVTDPCSGGSVSNVSTSAELLTALGMARSCDTILLAPGNYADIYIYGPSIANVNPNYPFTNYVTIASENPSDPATFAVLGVGAMNYLRFKNLRIHHPKRHCMPGTSGNACVPDPNNLCGAMDAPEDCEQEFVKAVEITGSSSHHIQFVNSELFGSTDSNHSNDIYGLYSEADDLLLDGNDFHDFTRGSVIGGEQIIVRNNYYHDLRSDGLDVGYSKNVIVDSNRHKNYRTCAAQNCADHPDFIQFFADGWDQTMKNVMIRDNVMLQGDGEVTQSILVQSNTGIPPAFPNRNFWIEGNVVYNGIVHGISIADTDNVTIQHNTILTSLRPSDIAGTVAINVQVAEHVLIQNNVSTALYDTYQINDLVSQSNVIAQNDPARLSDPYHYDNLFLNANAGDNAVLNDFRPRPGSALIVNPGRDIGAIEYDATPDQLTAVILADPGLGAAPLSVHFDASLSGGPNSVTNYLWNFDDGTFSSDAITDHTFQNPRTYQVELTVTDSSEASAISQKTIYVNPPPIVGLIYGLTLDGSVLDYSGNQIPTQWNGTTNYVPGVYNQAAQFDGTNSGSFVTATHRPPLDGMSALTIAFWAKKPADDFVTGGMVLHKHVTYEAYVDGNSLGGYLFNDLGTPVYFSGSSNNIQNSDWHHYAITYDGALVTIYLDGQSIGTATATGNVAINPDRDLTIGKDLENNSPTFKGIVDELKIYNLSLTSVEIQALAAQPPQPTPPVAPSNLHATRFGSVSVDLTWDDNSTDETEFIIERKDGANGNYQEVHRTAENVNQYADDTMAPNSEYYYRVKATNAAGDSDYSNELLVATGMAGGTAIYVDQQLASDCVNGDYSVMDRSCTGSEGRAYNTIQEAANVASPGDTVFIRGGTYQNSVNNCPQAECNLVNVTRSGTAQQPIVFRAFQNEQVVLSGLGFHDEDANSDGQADGPNFTAKSEALFRITADYIYVIGVEATNSNRYGFVVRGNYNQIQDSSSHDNWLNGFVIGGSTAPAPTDNSLIRCESHHNRHHSGILVNLGTRTLIEECLSYKNGRDANDNQVLPVGGDPQGGGNSDGITFEHYCSASSPNLCPNNVIRKSVAFKNTDDGIDFTFTDSLLDSNISFQNGPNGSKGFKQFSQTPNLIFVGNIAYDNPGAGFELRNQDGAQYYNNFATHNSTWGMIFSNQFTAHNNMAVGNHLSGNRDVNVTCVNCTISHNWWGDASHSGPIEHSGDPLLANPIPTINMAFPGGSNISERLNFIKSQFSTAFSLQSTSAAIDAGMQVSYTDPISGQVTSVPFNDAAPDIGAYEYRVIPNSVIYADQLLTENCNSGNYSIVNRSCSGSDGNAFRTIQEAVDHVQAGYHVYVRSGTYPEAVHIVIDGTGTDPIVLEGYNNERPVIAGVGFEDRDLNLDGDADGPLGPVVNQLFIEADYIQVRGLEVTNSTSGGVVVRGSFNVIENVISHDNWFTNFLINPRESAIEGNTIRNVEGYRSRHGGGIVLDHTVPASGPLGFNQAHTIEDSLFYRNGYQPDGNVVLPIAGDPAGGGNSDGLSASKDCNDEIARAITPTDNLCPNNVVKNNIVFGNADDGFDVSFAHSRLENNISFGNGPRGNRGIKLLRPVTDITFSGNILIANNDPGFELRGSLHKLYNNLSIRNVGRGFTGIATDFVFKNNLAAFNGGLNIAGSCSDCSNNWNGTTDGDPLLVNDAANIDVNLPLNASIQERRQFIINQFQGAYGLQNNSPLIDSGIIVANYHCAQSDDIDPNQTNCIHWSGIAPDIGAYEYQSGNPANQPPQVNAGSDVDMTLPATSTTLNGTVTDDGLPTPPGAVVIQWNQIGGPVNAVIESPNSAITNVSSLTQAGTYTFQLSADDDGNGPNVPVTDDVVVLVNPAGAIPNAPSDLTAGNPTFNSIDLTWVDNSDNEDGFILERKEGISGNYQEIYQSGPNATQHTDDTLQSNSDYYFRVKAFNQFGASDYSNEVQVNTSNTTLLPIYVDPQLASDCRSLNYSVANRDCTGTDGNAYSTIQEAANTVQAGQSILILSGIYRERVVIARSGAQNNPITIRGGFGGGETVIDGENLRAQAMQVYGGNGVAVEYVNVSDLTLMRATGNGLEVVNGHYLNFDRIISKEHELHGSMWKGFSAGGSHDIVVRNSFFFRNGLSGKGAGMRIGDRADHYVYNMLVEDTVSHSNCYPTGTGPELGCETGTGFNINSPENLPGGATHDITLRRVVAYNNGSTGISTQLPNRVFVEDSIAFDNNIRQTPNGEGYGFRMAFSGDEQKIIRGISFNNKRTGIQFENITNGEVYGSVAYRNAWGGTQGGFYSQTPIVAKNNISYLNTNGDFEIIVGSSTHNFVGDGNLPSGEQNSLTGNPEFVNPPLSGSDLGVRTCCDGNGQEIPGNDLMSYSQIYDQLVARFGLASTSTAIDSGIFISELYCAQSDDVDPNQTDCIRWSGSAPDIGAIEFQSGAPQNQPPQVSAGSDVDMALPTTSTTLSGSVTDDGLPSPPGAVVIQWTQIGGPSDVSFESPNSAVTNATGFVNAGIYSLQLSADDNANDQIPAVTDEVLVTVAASGNGQNFYVDVNHVNANDDTNPNRGAEDLPYRSIQYALDHINANQGPLPGDAVIVKSGVYQKSGGENTRIIRIVNKHGTETHPIGLRAEPIGSVILDSDGNPNGQGQFTAVEIINSSYLNFIGFKVRNGRSSAIDVLANSTQAGWSGPGSAHHISIEQCEVYNKHPYYSGSQSWSPGIKVTGPAHYVSIKKNYVHHWFSGIGFYEAPTQTYGTAATPPIAGNNGYAQTMPESEWNSWAGWTEIAARWCLVEDNIAHNNTSITNRGNADNFISRYVIDSVFRNNIAYNDFSSPAETQTIDDGFDMTGMTRGEFNGNIAFHISYNAQNPVEGDGNGMKIGVRGALDPLVHHNVSFYNYRMGLDMGYSLRSKIYNNTIWYHSLAAEGESQNNDYGLFSDISDDHRPVTVSGVTVVNNVVKNSRQRDMGKSSRTIIDNVDYNSISDDGAGQFALPQGSHSLISNDPRFANEDFNIDTNFQPDWTMDQKLDHIRSQVRDRLSLRSDSNCVDAGTEVSGITDGFSGDAPDIGAFESQPQNPQNQPPQVSAGSDVDMTLPTTSTTLSGSVTDDGLPSPPGAVVIQWTQIGGPVNAVIESPNSAITNVSSLTQAGTYTFQLSADDDGNGPNVPVTDDVVVAVNLAPATPPTSPSNLTISNITDHSIDLNWTDNSNNETAFIIERDTNSNFTQATSINRPADSTSYSDSGLQTGVTYYYRVKATNNGADSAYSNVVNGTTSDVISGDNFTEDYLNLNRVQTLTNVQWDNITNVQPSLVQPGHFIPDNNTVTQLNFENDALIGDDSSPFAIDMTCTSCPTSAAGRIGNAASFSGTQGLLTGIQHDRYKFTNKDITWAAWVQTTATGTRPILGTYCGYGHLESDLKIINGRASFTVNPASTNSFTLTSQAANLNDGQWHHVAAVRNAQNGTMSVFVDGALDSSLVGDPLGGDISCGRFGIGMNSINGPSGNEYIGKLDDVMIADRELTAGEIAHLAAGTNTVGYLESSQLALAQPIFSLFTSINETNVGKSRVEVTFDNVHWCAASGDLNNPSCLFPSNQLKYRVNFLDETVLDSLNFQFDSTARCMDFDRDGYGIGTDRSACAHPEEDCDDTNPYIFPGNPNSFCQCGGQGPQAEVCEDGSDNDCDGAVDMDDNTCYSAGNIFYVSDLLGDDANLGTSPDQAWKSVSRAQSLLSLNLVTAGDKILFRKGDVWQSAYLNITNKNGTEQNPLTIGSYGIGAKPLFLISDSGPIIAIRNSSYVVLDGLHLTRSDSTLDVRSIDFDPQVPPNHITIRNMHVQGCASGIYVYGDYHLIENNLIEDNENSLSGGGHSQGIWMGGTSANGIIRNNQFHRNGKAGVMFDHNIYKGGSGDNWLIENNEFTGESGTSIVFHGVQSGHIVRNNRFHDNRDFPIDISDHSTGQFLQNILVEKNRIYNNARGGFWIRGPQNVTVRNNLFYNNGQIFNIGPGIDRPLSGFVVENNTFVNNGGIMSVGDEGDFTIRNNIIYSSSNSTIFDVGNTIANMSNNLYRLPQPNQNYFRLQGVARNLTGMQALGYEDSSFTADPQFLDLANLNFQLQVSSPAIDTGMNVSLVDDFASQPRPVDGNQSGTSEFDIGAFEYQTGLPPANNPPSVNAGVDFEVTLPNLANLDGTVTDDNLPNPPGAVVVEWTQASGPGNVLFGDANAIDTTASFSQSGIYILRLSADDDGNGPNLPVTDDVIVTVIPAPLNPPSPPSNLNVGNVTSDSVSLSWQDNSNNETGFRVYRSVNDNSNYQLHADLVQDQATFTDTNLTPNTHYFYKVRSYNADGESPDSNEVEAVTSSGSNTCEPIDYWSVSGENPPIDISSFPLIQANTSGDNAALNFFNCSPTSTVGRWPGYVNGQPVNGGLPQLGDLQAHLAAFEASVVAQIPDPNWSGYAVIDFETWHPIWERNSGHQIYIDESKNLVRQAHPDWSDAQIEAEAQIEWEASARQFFEQTVLRAKQLRPNGKWGYYSTPDRIYYSFQNFSQGDPCFVYGIGYTDCQRAISDRMTWLWQAVDVLYPSIYQFFSSGIEVPVEDNEQYVRSMMQESVRVAGNVGGRKILPYTWSIYHNSGHYHGNFLNENDRRLSYSVPLEYGVDGIILWGWMRFFIDPAETTRQESNFLQSTLGPNLVQINNNRCGATAQHACSDGLDNDGDQLFDYPADPGCSSRDDDDESHSVAIPQAPANLTLTALSSTDVYLHWDDLSNEEVGFLIERKLDNGNFVQMPYNVTTNVTQYFDRELTVGTHYTYRIRAFNTAGFSAYSNEVMFGTLNEDLDFDYYSTQGGGSVCGPSGIEACNVGIDCDDHNAAIHPNAVELCDQLDNNCDGQADENFDLNQDPNNCGVCGNACDDANQCTGQEICQAGSCVSQNPIDCSDSVACTDDLCNPSDGSCAHVANNNHCGANQVCDSALGCLDSDFCSTHAEGTPCDDNLFCTVGEVCQAGQCGGGAPKDCSGADDQCHVGVCDEGRDECVPQNGHEGDVCDDGNLCTSGETCSSGQCTSGISTDCVALDDQCNAGVCNPSTGACEKQPVTDGTSCDDTNVCTSSDSCHSGACAGVQIADCVACSNDNNCSSLNSACKQASCNLSAGLCELTNRPDGTLCADSNLCNGSEMCLSGICQSGTSVNCDDSNACTQDACDPATGACLRSQISCDDGLACSLDTCNLASGCQHDTSQCDNGQTPGNSNNNSAVNIGTPVPTGGIGGVVVLGSGVANNVTPATEGANTLPNEALTGNLATQTRLGNLPNSQGSGKPFYYHGSTYVTDSSDDTGSVFIQLLYGARELLSKNPVSMTENIVRKEVEKYRVLKPQSKPSIKPSPIVQEKPIIQVNWLEHLKKLIQAWLQKFKRS